MTPIADMVEQMISQGVTADLIVLAIRTVERCSNVSATLHATPQATLRSRRWRAKRKLDQQPAEANDAAASVAEKRHTHAPPPADLSTVFDEFWRAYPKRDGANPKAPAKKKFIAAVKSGTLPEKIISGARKYATQARAKNQIGTPYIAQAMTWLNQMRYEDYYAPPATADTMQGPLGSPTDQELRKRYGTADNSSSSEATNGHSAVEDIEGADHVEKLRSSGAGIRAGFEPGGIPDDYDQHPRMQSMGKVF